MRHKFQVHHRVLGNNAKWDNLSKGQSLHNDEPTFQNKGHKPKFSATISAQELEIIDKWSISNQSRAAGEKEREWEWEF